MTQPHAPELTDVANLAAKTGSLSLHIDRELNGELSGENAARSIPSVCYLLMVVPLDGAAGGSFRIAIGSNLPDPAIPSFMVRVLQSLAAADAAAQEATTGVGDGAS